MSQTKNQITQVVNVIQSYVANAQNNGATGNGTTDDLPFINSAITALSGSGDLYFPKGTYRIASNLTVAAGIRFVFEQGAMISVDGIAISAITKANPGEVTTSSAHGFSNGDKVRFKDVGGMVELNYSTNGNVEYTVTVVNSTKFTIGVNTSSYTTYTSGGYAQHILTINSEPDAGLYQIFAGDGSVSHAKCNYPEQWGAVGDGVTDDFNPIQEAVNAGTMVEFSGKTYAILATITISKNNSTIVGNLNTQIRAPENDYAFDIDANNVKLQSMDFYHCRVAEILAGKSNISFLEITGDGQRTSGANSVAGIWANNTTGIIVDKCRLKNYYDAVFLTGSDSSYPTTKGFITNSRFSHDTGQHGTDNFPAGVYLWHAYDICIDNCLFQDIIPGGTNPQRSGFGVYEGDGSCDGTLIVTNCVFRWDDTLDNITTGILLSRAKQAIIKGNTFDIINPSGSLRGIRINPVSNVNNSFIIVGNVLNNVDISIFDNVGSAELGQLIINNNTIHGGYDGINIVGYSTKNITHVKICNNIIKNISRMPIIVTYANILEIEDNIVIDGNTLNAYDAGDAYYYNGISARASNYASIQRNYVANYSDGYMRYGIYNEVLPKQEVKGNTIVGMVTGNYYGVLTGIPTTGTWERDEIIYFTNSSAGGRTAAVVLVSGTLGTLTGVTGSINTGETALTVNDADSLAVGKYITIVGVSGAKRIVHILGTTVTIHSASDATVVDAVVAYSPPTFGYSGHAVLDGSVVWDPGNLVDGTGETKQISVTGAALGDFVIVAPPYDLQGLICTGYVQSANVVEIRLQNETGGAIDLASDTWKIRITK